VSFSTTSSSKYEIPQFTTTPSSSSSTTQHHSLPQQKKHQKKDGSAWSPVLSHSQELYVSQDSWSLPIPFLLSCGDDDESTDEETDDESNDFHTFPLNCLPPIAPQIEND